MARCFDGRVFSSIDGGRRWHRAPIPIPGASDARFDLPTFVGQSGVVAATLETRPATVGGNTRAIVFAVTLDGGAHWSLRATRKIASCTVDPYYATLWPASVANAHVWWIVAGLRRPVVQVTADAGRQWRAVVAHGLPSRACSVMSVSAAGADVAWVVARQGTSGSALFQTRDGGRTWRRTVLLRG
jgi:hypothetical protein